MLWDLFEAAVLGLVEGLTEFIPVSSTAHLLLLSHFMGFESSGKTFEVLIQLGAVLAIVVAYFGRLWRILLSAPRDRATQRFILGVALAFLPAAVLGVLLHGFIKRVLFESPTLICCTLIIGGLALLYIDQLRLRIRYDDPWNFPPGLALKIGLCQCLALIPGMSRSGSTIGGALLLGVSKPAATEFSFFLALPTMAGAFTYDLIKNWHALDFRDAQLIGVGFVVAFTSALLVVRSLIPFVGRHGFAPFAYWRLLVGAAGLAALWVGL